MLPMMMYKCWFEVNDDDDHNNLTILYDVFVIWDANEKKKMKWWSINWCDWLPINCLNWNQIEHTHREKDH